MATNVHWISCGSESLHIIGTCPNCYATNAGLILGTTTTGYAGRITATCVECAMMVDYFVDSTIQRIWKMDPVESRKVNYDQHPAT